jgi:hypothetical protein
MNAIACGFNPLQFSKCLFGSKSLCIGNERFFRCVAKFNFMHAHNYGNRVQNNFIFFLKTLVKLLKGKKVTLFCKK